MGQDERMSVEDERNLGRAIQALLRIEREAEILRDEAAATRIQATEALGAVEALLDGFDVGQAELDLDGLDVPERIGSAVDVDNVVVVEAADDVNDGLGFPDIAEETVAEALALAGALDEPRDIHEFHRRGDDLGRVHDGIELAEPVVGDRDHAGIRLDGAERVVLGLNARGRQGIENGALAHIGQSDDC